MLTLPMLNTLLSNPALTPIDRIPLLHAKITLLSNGPTSSSAGQAPNDPFTPIPRSSLAEAGDTARVGKEEVKRLREEMQARIEVAGLFVGLKPARVVEAENELTIVEGRLKGVLKAHQRKTTGAGSAEEESGIVLDISPEDIDTLRCLRIEALTQLADVEEMLGRQGRAKRWKELVDKLRGETEGQ